MGSVVNAMALVDGHENDFQQWAIESGVRAGGRGSVLSNEPACLFQG